MKNEKISSQKLISEYGEKLILYMKENKNLKTQIKDLKITLSINKEMLNNQIKNLSVNPDSKNQMSEIISSLQKENNQITERNNKLYNDNLNLEKKICLLNQEIKEKIKNYDEQIKESNNKIFILSNKLIEKDNIIKNLNKELNKYSRDEDIIKEIIIIEPDKNNIEINNELVETRQLLNKYTQLLHKEKQKNNIQEKKISSLLERIDDLKKKRKIKERMENIEMFDYILSSSSISEENSNQNHSLESPVIKFPEKIKQKKCLTTDIHNYKKKPPKLDFSKLLIEKYPPLKQIKVIDGTKESPNNNDNEYIEKIKFQLKFFKNSNQELQKQNNDLKKIVSVLKTKYLNLKNSIIYNSNSTQETEKEKYNCLKINHINNILIKKKNNKDNKDGNLSMDVNSNQIDIDSIYEGSDFNYVIKEFNKNINNN